MCTQNTSNHRQCVICNRKLIGRSDKRFCDIRCKNYYHSQVRSSMKGVVMETMKILKHNYVQLSGMLGEKDTCVADKLALERKGFRFNYVTDTESAHGSIYYGIFELKYRIIKNKILITADKNRKPVSPFIFERWNREFAETGKIYQTEIGST